MCSNDSKSWKWYQTRINAVLSAFKEATPQQLQTFARAAQVIDEPGFAPDRRYFVEKITFANRRTDIPGLLRSR
jgi:hypothetical protein